MTANASPPRRLAGFVVGLLSAIAGLALGALFSSTTDASAQDRLASFAERNNLGEDHADDAELLFAHTASGGSALKKDGSRGEWVVKFKGVPGKALAFEDRPGRREEPIRMERMLAGFFAKPGAVPPNAALSLETRGGEQTLVGVELLDGRFNRDRGVTRYRLRSLKLHGDQPLRLPRRFGEASVFIDDVFANYCGEIAINGVGEPLTLAGANKAEHSGWDLQGWVGGDPDPGGPPPGVIAPNTWSIWGNGSSIGYGCWNNAGYQGENGSVEFSVGTPYSDPNTWSCTTTGIYVCNGPFPYFSDGIAGDIDYWPGLPSRSGGSTTVIWVICTTSEPNCFPTKPIERSS